MEISFNGKPTPSFLIIQNLKFPVLPSISQNTKKANGRAGMLDYGNEIGVREIQVDISIVANTINQFSQYKEDLAEWLYYDEPVKLVHSNNPTKFVWAKVLGDIELDEIFGSKMYGKGTITFICYDPFIYNNFATEEIFAPTNLVPHTVSNGGNISLFPEFNIKFKRDTTQLSIVTPQRQLTFGKSANIDTDTIVDTDPLILDEGMQSTSGWVQSSTAEGGTVTGSFVSNGYSFQAGEYGAGTKWHGASMHKALPKSVQDFSISTFIGFRSYNDVANVGKIDIYLKDANNLTIAKMTIYDTSTIFDIPTVGARLGSVEGDYPIVTSHGSYKGALQGLTKGILRMKRIGNVWKFYFAKILNDGRHVEGVVKEYVNTNNLWSNKVARVQIAIMSYGETPPVNEMYVSGLQVWEHNSLNNDNEVPLRFKQGDDLYINNGTGEILLNGEPYYDTLDPASQFIELPKGDSQIQAYPIECIDETKSKIRYRERWL